MNIQSLSRRRRQGYESAGFSRSPYRDLVSCRKAIATILGRYTHSIWYDPSNKASLYTDIARTTPVVNSGDTVGSMSDLSGNGWHAVAISDPARPLYQIDAQNRCYLLFDGTDDAMKTSTTYTLSTLGATKITCVIPSTKLSDASGAKLLVEHTADSSGQNGSFALFDPLTAGTSSANARSGGTTRVTIAGSGYHALNETAVLSLVSDISSPSLTIRKNTYTSSSSTATQGSGSFADATCYFCSRAGTGLYPFSRIYEIFIIPDVLSEKELRIFERYSMLRSLMNAG